MSNQIFNRVCKLDNHDKADAFLWSYFERKTQKYKERSPLFQLTYWLCWFICIKTYGLTDTQSVDQSEKQNHTSRMFRVILLFVLICLTINIIEINAYKRHHNGGYDYFQFYRFFSTQSFRTFTFFSFLKYHSYRVLSSCSNSESMVFSINFAINISICMLSSWINANMDTRSTASRCSCNRLYYEQIRNSIFNSLLNAFTLIGTLDQTTFQALLNTANPSQLAQQLLTTSGSLTTLTGK